MALHAAASNNLQHQQYKMQRQVVYKLDSRKYKSIARWLRNADRLHTLSTLWGSMSTSTTCGVSESHIASGGDCEGSEIIPAQ